VTQGQNYALNKQFFRGRYMLKKTMVMLGLIMAVEAVIAQESPEQLAKDYVAAVAAKDLEAVKAVYTEEVDSFLSAGGIATSREAIAIAWEELFKAYDNIQMYTREAGFFGNTTMRTSWGNWGMTAIDINSGQAVEWKGTYMDLSIKTSEGWKYRADLAPVRTFTQGRTSLEE